MKKKFFDKPALVLLSQIGSLGLGIGGGVYMDKNHPHEVTYEYLNHCSRQFETVTEAKPYAYRMIGVPLGFLGYSLLWWGRANRKEQEEKENEKK